MSPLATFIAGVDERPIYVASRTADYSLDIAPVVEARLRRAFSSIQFIFARGLYLDTADWLERWPAERHRYGGMILMTWADCVPSQFDGPRGEHVIGLGMMRELLDISRSCRRVLWLANEFPQWFSVERFSIKRPSGEFSARSFGSLAPWHRAAPFKPGISPILVRIAGAFERAPQ